MATASLQPATINLEVKPAGPYRAHRILLSPQRVRELSTLRPWRSVLDTAICWLTIIAAWALATWSLTAAGHVWWAVPLAIIVIGTRYYALFIIGHDGMHRRIFNSGPASELFTDLLLIGPVGMVCRINARNHLDHHQHLATDLDPDLHKHACFNKTTRPEYLAFLTGLASVFVVLRNLFLKPFTRSASTHSSAPAARARYTPRDVVIILGWQIAISVGLTTAIGLARGGTDPLAVLIRGWFAYPLLWLLPVYLFAYLPNLIRSFVEHSHPENDDHADHHRLITFISHPVERLFLAPKNMNFHIAHHLWPSIPYYNLPVADAEARRNASTDELTWRGLYIAYLWRYFVALPLAECRSSRHKARRA